MRKLSLTLAVLSVVLSVSMVSANDSVLIPGEYVVYMEKSAYATDRLDALGAKWEFMEAESNARGQYVFLVENARNDSGDLWERLFKDEKVIGIVPNDFREKMR